jgi:hypothetical protein
VYGTDKNLIGKAHDIARGAIVNDKDGKKKKVID